MRRTTLQSDNQQPSAGAADGAEMALDLARYPRAAMVETVRQLSQVNGWRTTWIIGRTWSIVLLSATVAVWSGHPLVYLASMVVIASQQLLFGVLVHDGAHWLLYRNRTVNDVVCDLFLAFPLSLSTTLYRETHFRHHRYTNSQQDPDLVFQEDDAEWATWPKSRWGCAWLLLKSLLGLNLHKAARAMRQWSPWWNLLSPIGESYPLRARILLVASTSALYIAVIASGQILPAILLWVVPSLTIVNLANRWRATAEHLKTSKTHELNSTRTVLPGVLGRWLIAPLGVNYHLEHHLFPSVPCTNLRQLHEVLMEDPRFCSRAHVTHTYLGVLAEWMTATTPEEESAPTRAAS